MSRGNGKQAQQAVASGKLSRFVKPSGGGENAVPTREYVDWGEIDWNLIAGAVIAVNREDGSLLFGHTRDKSSYSVVVFYGGDKNSYYFPCNESGVEALRVFLLGLVELAE